MKKQDAPKPLVKPTPKPRAKATTAKEKPLVPQLFEVAKFILPDDEAFLPVIQEEGKYCNVHVNPQFKPNNQVHIYHRSTEVIDFGCRIGLPVGYRINGALHVKYAVMGLICSQVYLDNDKRLKFVVTNCGKQTPVVLALKEALGMIWVESNFSWS